jgi:hypothetical protein
MLLALGLLTSTAGFAQAVGGPSIAYVKGTTKGDAIFLVNPDGTGLTKVYQAPRQGRFASQIDRVTIKPGGGEVAFVQDSADLIVQPFDSNGQPVGSAYQVALSSTRCSTYDPDYRSDGYLYVAGCGETVWKVAPGATSGTEWFAPDVSVGALAALGTSLLYIDGNPVGVSGGNAQLKTRDSSDATTSIASLTYDFPAYLDAAGGVAVLSEAASFRTINLSTGEVSPGCTAGGMVKLSPTGSQMVYEFRNFLLILNSDCSGSPFRLARGAKSVAWRSN